MQPQIRAESNALSDCEPPSGSQESKGNDLPQAYFVYILRCRDGSYYVGSTTDLEARIATHNRGEGAAWTRARRPVTLMHHEGFNSEIAAVRRERQLKGWSKAKKDALIAGDRRRLHALADCRTESILPPSS